MRLIVQSLKKYKKNRFNIMKNKFFLLFILSLFCFACAGKSVDVVNVEDSKNDYEKFVKFIEKKKQSEDSVIVIAKADIKEKEEVKKTKESSQEILDASLEECKYSQEYWKKGKIERAILSLDNAYELLLKVRSAKELEIVRQREDIRFLISKRLLRMYATKANSVKGDYKEIPIILNKYVQREVDYFMKHQRTFFIESLQRSGRYRPKIVEELKKAGLPVELSWLPLVESGFKAKAFSKARALGLWQFIASTGYKFGLERNSFMDERLHFEKSTKAAISYLKTLHGLFGDWATSLAAYNCGEGRVLREIRKQKLSYKDDFWDIYKKLPSETARYYPRFIATLHIVENLDKYGLKNIKLNKPYKYDIVAVEKQISLKDIAKKIGTDTKTLAVLNPSLVHKILPNKKYNLKIPKGKSSILLASINKIKVSKLPSPAFVLYKVRYGDSISTIAKKFRTNTRDIIKANRINRRNYIAVGQILKIPRGKRYKNTYVKSFNYARMVKYKVRRGDSIWIIAKRFSTSIKHIAIVNKLRSSKIFINQILKIPVKSIKMSDNGKI